MDAATFIVELLRVLAWPATVLVCVILLRAPLGQAAKFVTRLKYRDIEMEFGKQVQSLEEVTRKASPATSPEPKSTETRSRLLDLATRSTTAAVVEAWRTVENELVDAGHRARIQVAPVVWTWPLVLAALMYRADLLSLEQTESVQALKKLRDEVAHATVKDVPLEVALSYVDSAVRIVDSLSATARGAL